MEIITNLICPAVVTLLSGLVSLHDQPLYFLHGGCALWWFTFVFTLIRIFGTTVFLSGAFPLCRATTKCLPWPSITTSVRRTTFPQVDLRCAIRQAFVYAVPVVLSINPAQQ